MADIPHELIVEILSRLPVKSLLRFRCVCKTWLNLISHSNFIQKHLNRAIERDDRNLIATTHEVFFKEAGSAHRFLLGQGLRFPSRKNLYLLSQTHIYCVYGNSFDKSIKMEDPLGELFHRSMLVGSCNGVICLVRHNQVCLVNPYTREYRIVRFEMEIILYDNSTYGFCYDSTNEDYMLVHFLMESTVNVYSLGHASCSTIISNVPDIVSHARQLMIFFNGAFYWIANHSYKGTQLIISLDVGEKVVREVPRPDNVGIDFYGEDLDAFITVGVVGGRLALFKRHNYTWNIEIWVTKNCGARDSWCKLVSIEEGVAHSSHNPWPLYFTKNTEFLYKDGRNLITYDLKKNTSTNLEVHGISNWARVDSIVTHVASLVPLKSGTFIGTVVEVEEKEQAE